MTDKDIELSKEGIKFSYRRFLSDSASGIIILIVIILYYDPISKFPQNLDLFIFFLLFLLSFPLGLAINALSFIILGDFVYKCEMFLFDLNWFFIRGTKTSFDFNACKNFFHLKKENWTCVTRRFEQMLEVYYQDRIESLEYVEGIKIFFRNIALISLVFGIILLPQVEIVITMFLLTILFIFCSSIISFYRFLSILYNIYILCLKFEQFEEIAGDINKITSCLLKEKR